MKKPLNEMTAKQLAAELKSARYQWGLRGSMASLYRLEAAEAETERRAA